MALTLGVTAVGAVVGGYFGNPMLGAQIGMMVGSVAGALLFPGGEDKKGARFGYLGVGDASYGVPIPIVYGTARVAGNMIWTSGLEERSNEQSMKGGGPTSTTYTYYSSFAVGLCEGPISGVRKIWLDTKLVYDMSSTNLGIVNQRIGDQDPRRLLTEDELEDRRDEISAELSKVQSALTIYLGTETQLPDPVMEAVEGIGQVPAHRGLAYLLFDDLALEAYGNRIPNISAEVMTTTAMAYPKVTLLPDAPSLHRDNLVLDPARQVLWAIQNQTITQVDALSNTVLRSETPATTAAAGGIIERGLTLGLEVDQDGALYVPIHMPGTRGRVARLDPVSLQVTHVNRSPLVLDIEDLWKINAIVAAPTFIWATSYGTRHEVYCFLRPGAIKPDGTPVVHLERTGLYTLEGGVGSGPFGKSLCVDRDQRAWVVCSAENRTAEPQTWLLWLDPTGIGPRLDISSDLAGGELIAYDLLTHSVVVAGYAPVTSGTPTVPRVVRVDCETRTVVAVMDHAVASSYVASAWHRGIVGRQLWISTGADVITALDVDSLTFTQAYDTSEGFPDSNAIYGGLYDGTTHAMWVMEDNLGFAKYYLDRVDAAGVPLSGIVTDLSRRAGLAPALVETTALSDTVHGFVHSQRAAARSALDALLAAFLVDGVESDWRLTFRHRALTPVATLTTQDLAAHEPGATLPDVLTPERLDDQQLPMRLDVTYADPARDYQDTTQHARRMQAGQRARSERELRTPVILTADQARQLAEQSLHEAWVSRTTYRLPVTYRWTTLDPGDVVTVDVGGRQTLVRLQQIANGANGLLEMQAVAYDRHIYRASASVGVIADARTAQTMTMLAPTGLFLLDTHLLRDIDTGPGYYMAMAPQGSGAWPGATAFSSMDGQAWRMEDTLTTAVDYGSALTVLAVGSAVVLDYGHTVDVRMARGALTSVSMAELLNGANAGLLGNEILQWQTATPLDATSWRLSHLLRGRRGTEWAIAGHTAGERFIVLTPATLRREDMGLSEVDTTRQYRAVTMNTDMLTPTAQAFRNTALGLKPYSPDHVHGTRTTTQDLTITWIRRTRLGGLWVDGRDVPLGETSEQYAVEILNGGAVVRTFEATTPTVTYTAAQQTTDFGAPQSSVQVVIYQLGQLGRGWPVTATV